MVSNFEVLMFDSGVVVFAHEVLVSCESLFSYLVDLAIDA